MTATITRPAVSVPAPPRRTDRPQAVKDFIRLADVGRANVLTLLEISRRLKRQPLSELRLLIGDTVVLYFNKPSTRTRISFETAVTHLGGVPLSVGPHELQLDRGETIEDTARVISAYAKAFVIRTYSDDDVRRFAAAASIPVINALTDGHHPCQALGDLLTLTELWGPVEGHRLAYVGDGGNVAHSLIEACAMLGIDVAVATPEGFEPDAAILGAARVMAQAAGSELMLTHDPYEAVRGADAVYTDVWLSMGTPESERDERRRTFRPFQVDGSLMAAAAAGAVFMHCLPAHRGEEVTGDVIDGPRSRVFEQAANRLPTEQAVLWALLTGALALPDVGRAEE